MAENYPTAGKKAHIAAVKILAALLVIFNHTGTYGFRQFTMAPHSPLFPFYLFLSILCAVAVPLFFMCSGALLLGRDEPLKKLYSHRILRYIAVLVLFSLAEYLFVNRHELSHFNPLRFLLKIYSTNVHGAYWFLYAYLACLILLPFLRKMARALDGREFIYLIALQVAFTGVIPVVEFLAGRNAYHLNPDLNLPLLSRGIFYMLAGYWAENVLDASRLSKRQIAAIGLAGFAAIALSGLLTVYKGVLDGRYAAELSLTFHTSFIAVPTIAIYILAKCLFTRAKIRESVVRATLYWGELTFGIYLIHIFVMRAFKYVAQHFVPYMGTFLYAVLVVFLTAAIAGGITAVLKRIPPFSKLI